MLVFYEMPIVFQFSDKERSSTSSPSCQQRPPLNPQQVAFTDDAKKPAPLIFRYRQSSAINSMNEISLERKRKSRYYGSDSWKEGKNQ